MLFGHDTESAMRAAVALVNSGAPPDTMTSQEHLSTFLVQHHYTGRVDNDAAELAAVRELRPVLRELLCSDDRDAAAALVNRVLADADAVPRLVRHGSVDWHLHAVDADEPLVTRIAVETAMAMIDLIRSDELSRLGICDDATCEALVLDLSRNRSRRFCSTACGNRAAVAAYRARKSR